MWRAVGGLLAAVVTAGMATRPAPHADGPPPGHTGGFGEPTCRVCHEGGALNAPGGTLGLDGLPASYRPGARYLITVVLAEAEMDRAGFQAAVRFATGRPAGRLEAVDARTAVIDTTASGMPYVQHTATGTRLTRPGLAEWQFAWTAPPTGAVQLHVAANSANGDNSPLGDLIYTAEVAARPR